MKIITSISIVVTIVGCLLTPVMGSPTACSVIPTADIMEPGTVRMEFENDGAPKIGAGDSVSLFLTQYGVTPNLEFGMDRSDISGEKVDTMNMKYLLYAESDTRPAIAIGIMDADDEGNRSYYAVGTRSFGKLRAHLGYIDADYSKGPMLGFDAELNDKTFFLAYWMKGDANYTSLGIYRTIGRFNLTFLYGFANDGDAVNYSSAVLSYTMPIAISF